MTQDQFLIFAILVLTMGLFLWGRFRHDVVALAALMACVVAGLVSAEDAFTGFGHPAVITVACVLVLSHGLQSSGAVDAMARTVLPEKAGRFTSMAALIGLGAALSGFMNNVGAMALLMPVAVQLAGRLELTPGQVLMPLAFGTILGGMTTLVGTPPNLIVSGFRAEAGMGAFGMFDFTPVGLVVAALGVGLIAVVGWRLVPAKTASSSENFETGAYMTEVRVPEDSKAVGQTLWEIEQKLEGPDSQILGLVRNDVRITAPHGGQRIVANDILLLETGVEELAEVLSSLDIVLEEQGSEGGDGEQSGGASRDRQGNGDHAAGKKIAPEAQNGDDQRADDIVLRELVVMPGARIVGRSATDLMVRTRYGINLLAVSREGQRPRARLRTLQLKSGDLLLMQGPADVLSTFAGDTGCVPLGERDLRIPDKHKAITAAAIMASAILLATFGVLPAAAAFALGVLASMVLNTVSPRAVYSAIDWPVIVLLAALIPVAGAMQASGAADLLAQFLVVSVAQGNAIAALAVIMITTMLLSDVMNNAATAAVMCPIAIGIAATLGVNADSFLMAVAIGASCAFLTPIGHQNNTLILGPGGFGFGDYWRLGLPLELLVLGVSIPLLLVVWPL